MRKPIALLATLAALAASTASHAQRPAPPQGPIYSGYLCCNMRTTGSKISDINYDESGKTVLAAGTPVSISRYDFRWLEIEVNGKTQRLLNDYSRELKMPEFAQRYVLKEDPRPRLAGYSSATQAAIQGSRVVPGMTREQVLMSVAYPVTSENPDPNAKVWRYWLDTWTEFQVVFDDSGVVQKVAADPATLARVSP